VRGVLAKVLTGLGAFLLTVAVLALLWVPSQVKKTPLNVDSTTRLDGTAVLGSGADAWKGPIKVTSISRTDSELSTGDVALFVNSTCVVKNQDGKAPDCVSAQDPDKRLISASTDTFATNRRTAEATNDFDALPADAEQKEGLVNKFPFDAEQRTYPFWDGSANKVVEATFEGQETLDGLVTNKYRTVVKGAAAEIAAGVKGTYDDDKVMWVEPASGSIMKQTEHRILKQDGKAVVDLNMKFTDEQVAANVKDGKANSSKLKLLTSTVPMLAGLLGLVSLAMGLFLASSIARARREDDLAYDARTVDDVNDTSLLDGVGEETTRRRGDLHN
jgi:hypothetical protein